MASGVFISGVGTGVGKTYVSRATSRAISRRGYKTSALKPIETGCDPDPLDAIALAEAVRNPDLAMLSGFYRARQSLSPYSIGLSESKSFVDVSAVIEAVKGVAELYDFTVVEGAGGLLTPVAPKITIADIAKELGFPVVIVAQDMLGVLSSTFMAVESCEMRQLPVACVVLSRHAPQAKSSEDISVETNADVMRKWINMPILELPNIVRDTKQLDDRLARAAEQCGLIDLILSLG
jgi:dethiobiotin synthetase